jgi:hypothetical protein
MSNKIKKELKIRLEIVELIHKIYMAEYKDLEKLDILSKIQRELLTSTIK